MIALARLSLANRTLIIMIAFLVGGFGLYAIPSLKQQLLPSLSFPAAFVVAQYRGASPEIVEEQVTEPLEDGVKGIAGITEVTSTSREGSAQVQVSFEYGTDIDDAVAKLQQAVGRVEPRLPDGVDPQVLAGSTDDLPVMVLAVGEAGDPRRMLDKIERVMVPELRGIEGVRDVTVTGAQEETVVITPDQGELFKLGIPVTAIPELLRANGTPVPAGSLSDDGRTLTVEVGTRVDTIEQLKNLYLSRPAQAAAAQPQAGRQGAAGQAGQAGQGRTPAAAAPARPKPVKLGDVALIERKPAEATTLTRTDGESTLGVSITMAPDGNAVTISHEVNAKLGDLVKALGDAAPITVVFDQAPYIERSIESLTTEGLLGLAFAVVVILVFLLSLRSTLVTAVSIPLSVVVALLALWIGDYSLNLLTLGALTIAIGRVVDDSIVVLENIKRHLSYGEAKRHAVLTGVREVSGAVTASTLTTVAVFAPIAFVGGMVGELFAPFAITVTVALLASLVVALTVIPVLAYWFLSAPKAESPERAREVREEAERKELRSPLQRAYLPVLRFATRRRLPTLAIGLAVFIGTMALLPGIKTNFIDSAGQDTIQLSQRMPAGTDLETTDAAAKKIEAILADTDGVDSYQVSVGSGGTFSFGSGGSPDRATFSVRVKQDADTSALEQTLRDRIAGLSGVGTVTVGGQGGGGFNANQLQVIVQGPDLKSLRAGAEAVTKAMSGIDGVRDVSSNLEDSAPRVQVRVDRREAAERGLTEVQIGEAIAQRFRGATIGQIDLDGRPGDIIMRTGDAPETLEAIRDLELPTPTGGVKVSAVADVERVDGPQQISRTDGERTASITGAAEAADLGRVTAALNERLQDLTLPAGVRYEIGGVSADQDEAFAQLGVAMLAAIAIVFMIMVATFRSFVQPLILLVSIPFAATGAIGLLRITDTALGVPALIGMLMLIGIVVTNAIVLIDLINQYREQGLGVVEAVMEGGRRRLRPILMTAVATICALVPMALGLTGEGGFISQPLAIVVIGGLVSSTLLTLVLVPTLYSLVERAKERMRRRGDAPPAPDTTVKQEQALASAP
ncbi:efflux RND transporter permease subunit [Thermopolyspora sp. NPDC052614]|uniref:efflux RND transporter permease subunit n=1 Tax=Thermopolyspora sp. NPDC052614 TaxID=3155682 RepID=UPI00344051F9